MDNTLSNRSQYNTSFEPQIRSAPMASTYQPNQGSLVFFLVDLNEMFGVNIDYPKMRTALYNAFTESKRYIPVDTGLMKRSYSMRFQSDTVVEVFFDPQIILGGSRDGKPVQDYYPQYVGSSGASNRAWNWLTIVMSHFYDKLISEVREIIRSGKTQERKEDNLSVAEISSLAILLLATFTEDRKKALEQQKEALKAKKEADLKEVERLKLIRKSVMLRRLA